ncbi:hypothetical protein HPB52_007792 [Rhipicephalus sanguineus]|uniref:Eukaryotic translation initiation factor 3 subunit L n=1 Tax=Rhipicephalus sanguineus TaxID=34632 RepID=A0A9D4SR00_RHISA|nr:hypothetical protein HPB52_007792 [Rhipicephalus sanguineus]
MCNACRHQKYVDNYGYPIHEGDLHGGYKLTEAMQSTLVFLKKAIQEGNLYEIQSIYENNLAKLMEQHSKVMPPPNSKEMAHILDDHIFMILYKELYYRQIYARGSPKIDERFESYYNYCALFNYILSTDGPVALVLPNQWLWELIDEFIYQFQSFSQYRSNLSKKSPDEIELLNTNPKIWNVHSVLNVLHSLVDKSNINLQLEVYTQGGDPDSVAGEFGQHPLYKMLGYFSLVGLLRLHSLLGDYYQAVKVLENLELNKKSLYSRVPACQITTYYYVGFAYLMMRRYADSIRTFSNILVYIQRTKHLFPTRTYQGDQINKQTDKMYALLAICLTLHPQRIDESILSHLKDKHGEQMNKMQRGVACPKFLNPVPPPLNAATLENKETRNYAKEPLQQQLNVFLSEVEGQLMIPTIRSFLKLYTTMPVSKLASFLEDSDGSSSLDGEFQSGSDVDFFIDRDMIHIADTKVARRYGDFYIRQYHKFEEVRQANPEPEALSLLQNRLTC